MLIIRTEGRLFENILDLIKEQERKGFKYLRDENDGASGRVGVCFICCKRVYFDDGKDVVTFENRTLHLDLI